VTPVARRLALLAAAVLLAFGGGRAVRRLHEPVVPAIVARTADAHDAVSRGLGARLGRLLHDRAPGDREHRPREIALTFDDGPYAVTTPLLLDALADLHVPATFFLIGRDAEQYPALAERIARAGHEIANHTLTHPNLDLLPDRAVRAELADGGAALERYARDPAIRTMMRPPHGRFTEATIRTAQAAGYDVILWNDDPGDWRYVPPGAIAARAATIAAHVLAHASAPEIVLLHSGQLATIEALPLIVRRYRAAGYRFVTVGALLRDVPVPQIVHPLKRAV